MNDQRCDRCHYWKKLVNTNESYGACTFPTSAAILPDPMRRIVEPYRDMFGSTAPDAGVNCRTFHLYIAPIPPTKWEPKP